MTCSPDHSRFLKVTETGSSSIYPGKVTVEKIDYRLADDFAARMLSACR